jgi:hypothetical protein
MIIWLYDSRYDVEPYAWKSSCELIANDSLPSVHINMSLMYYTWYGKSFISKIFELADDYDFVTRPEGYRYNGMSYYTNYVTHTSSFPGDRFVEPVYGTMNTSASNGNANANGTGTGTAATQSNFNFTRRNPGRNVIRNSSLSSGEDTRNSYADEAYYYALRRTHINVTQQIEDVQTAANNQGLVIMFQSTFHQGNLTQTGGIFLTRLITMRYVLCLRICISICA